MTAFLCNVCGKSFNQKKNLNQHVKGVHEEILYACRKCEKTYTRNNKRLKHEAKCIDARIKKLIQHVKDVHREKRIPCGNCEKSYIRNSVRLAHEAKCNRITSYICSFCGIVHNTVRELHFHV